VKIRLVAFGGVGKQCELGDTEYLAINISHAIPPQLSVGIEDTERQTVR
jgi:hypothetical protein